jgi:hypothetical protein
MSLLAEFSRWLQATEWATSIRESENVFSLLLVIHVLGLALLVGTVFVVDLRLLGWRFRSEPVLPFTRSLLRITWAGFWVLAVSGLPLLAAQAANLYGNPFLRAKFLLLIVVGLNALVFERIVSRGIEVWGLAESPPRSAKVVATISLVSWVALVGVGRLIPYFDSK